LSYLIKTDVLTGEQARNRQEYRQPSSLKMCCVYVDGHKTNVRLEPVVWETLRRIADRKGISVHKLVSAIDQNRVASSLTSAIRTYIITYLMARTPSKWFAL
jgi:predicted DNA-binding ribbon-helix-helix protein